MQKKIKRPLFLTIDFPPMCGGMARHSYDVYMAMKYIGLDPVVIAPSPVDGSGAIDGPAIHRLKSIKSGRIFDNYFGSVLAFFFRTLRYCLAHEAALVIANTWSIAGVAAFLIKKATGVPYAVFAHGLDVYAPQMSPRVKWLMDIVLENASVVITNSAFTKRLVEEATNRANIVVLNPMVDASRLASGAGPGGGDDRGRRKALLTVARLVESKGHDLVIRSLPKVIAAFPDIVYRIVGSGPQETALRKLAAELGVSNQVIFTGEVDEGALTAYYRGCDIFILTSRQIRARGEVEGFGIVFLEAAVFAKPVIAARSGGISDAVLDGVTGLLVDPAEPETIAGAAIKLLSDKGLANRLGEAGRARVEREFGLEPFAEKLKDITGRFFAQ